MPKSNSAVIHTFPDLEDSVFPVSNILLAEGITVNVLTHARRPLRPNQLPKEVNLFWKYSPRAFSAYFRARFVFFTHSLFLSPAPVDQMVVINLWHGMPIKHIGVDVEGVFKPRFDLTFATSETFKTILSRAFNVPESSVVIARPPRTFSLLHCARDTGPAFVAWLPTYRRSVTGASRADGRTVEPFDREQVRRLYEAVDSAGLALYAKLHPMADPSDLKDFEALGISVITDEDLRQMGTSTYQWLANSTALITDYSSVAVDWIFTMKPLFFLQDDQNEYAKTRGFYFDFADLCAIGDVFSSIGDLARGIGPALASTTPSIPPPEGRDRFVSSELLDASAGERQWFDAILQLEKVRGWAPLSHNPPRAHG